MKKISSNLYGFHLAKPPDVEKQHSPCQDMTEDGKKRHNELFDATIKGNWTRAEEILKKNPECATHSITIRKETVVHIAAAGKNKEFVEKLMKILQKMGDESYCILEQPNTLGCSAFYLAVLSGVVDNAKIMVEKNIKLPTIRSKDKPDDDDDIGKLPINRAALRGRKKMVAYLFQKTPFEMLQEADRIELLQATIRYDMYDTALQIVDKDSTLATKEYDTQRNRTFLHLLARKALAERSWRRFLGSTCAVFSARLRDAIQEKTSARGLLEKIWGEWDDLKLPEEPLAEKIRKTEILHYAAKEGNVEFLSMILNKKPDLLWEFNSKGQNIFHIAVLHRQKDVFDLIYKFGPFKDLISVQQDNQQNNILHLTAKLWTSRSSKESTGDDNPQRPSVCFKLENGSEVDNKVEKDLPKSLLKVSGAALRLQRELLWFMEVGNVVPPSQHKIRNKENKTPKQIFAEEHRELLKEGEKWMTDTATSCMLVATLIATMVFAAAFTVPGGSNGDTGTPVFIKRSSFTVFMISDAVAMICSIISIIMFLSILISRFRQDDFLVSLPLKLLVGLTTLFVSIVGMLVAFAVAFSLIFAKAWQPKLIVASIVAPFALFLLLNFNLWFDTIKSLWFVVTIKLGSFKKLYFG